MRKLAVRPVRSPKHSEQPKTNATWSSRRKACDRCVRGKRRCDGGKPCIRCSKRGLRCDFAPSQESEPERQSTATDALTTDGWKDCPTSDFDIDLSWLEAKHFTGTYIDFYNRLPPDTTVQISTWHMDQLVQRIQSSVHNMAESAQTPFLKPLEFDGQAADSFLDEVLLVCSGYLHRTKSNRASLNRTIARKYIRLTQALRGYMKLDSLLPALQAAILFEIMLLFDEDKGLRGLGERLFPTVEAAMNDLQQQLIEELAYPTFCPGNDLTSQYFRWILHESIRRVVFAHWILKAAYTHSRDGYCELVPVLVTLPLTRSGDLWTASSEHEWLLKAQQEPMQADVVPYLEAVDFWIENNCINMDDFQVMLFETCKVMPANAKWSTLKRR